MGSWCGTPWPYVLRHRPALLLAGVLVWSTCSAPATSLLRVGTKVWIGSEPLYVAAERGRFEGTPVRLIDYSSGSQAISAFRNRSIEAASLTLDEALELAQNDDDVRIVLVEDISAGADVLLSTPATSTLADLRGQRIGYESTAAGAFLLSRALEAGGLTPEDVVPVPVQFDEHEKAFSDGRVDAVVTFEPARTRLLTLGARELFSTRDLPNEVIDVIVVRASVMANDPDAIASLLRGWFDGVDAVVSEPDAFERQTAKRLGLTVDEVRNAYRLIELGTRATNQRWLVPTPPLLREVESRIGAFMFSRQLLRHPVQDRSIIDAEPVRRFLGVERTP